MNGIVIEGGIVTLAIFILGLIWNAASAYFTISGLKSGDLKNKERINHLEVEQLRMVEALERTYATEKFVYNAYVTRKEHTQSMERLEEKLLIEMRHINEALTSISKAIGNSLEDT
jgi:hypothetical protein